MPLEYIFKDAPGSHLPFSPAVKAGELVFVSGQASVDSEGRIISGTFEEEFRQSFSNVQQVLAAAGMTLKNVVKVNSYVDSSQHLAEYNRLCREIFSPPFPARTTLVNCLAGTGIKFEVDVVAHEAGR